MRVTNQFQVLDATQAVAFRRHRFADQAQLRGCFHDDVLPGIGGTEHQHTLAIHRPDDGNPGKQETGGRSRETGKHHARDEGDTDHADEDFDGCDAVSVQGLRMHIAVTDGRQRLDAEEEIADQARRIEIGDAARDGVIEQRKDDVERQKRQRQAHEQARPADRHRVVVEILPDPPFETVGDDFALAEAHAAEPARSVGWPARRLVSAFHASVHVRAKSGQCRPARPSCHYNRTATGPIVPRRARQGPPHDRLLHGLRAQQGAYRCPAA